jgi:NAD-dependent SIR2 family protein deacetylase
VHEARRRGAFTAEINPAATDASRAVDVTIAIPAEQALPAIGRLISD